MMVMTSFFYHRDAVYLLQKCQKGKSMRKCKIRNTHRIVYVWLQEIYIDPITSSDDKDELSELDLLHDKCMKFQCRVGFSVLITENDRPSLHFLECFYNPFCLTMDHLRRMCRGESFWCDLDVADRLSQTLLIFFYRMPEVLPRIRDSNECNHVKKTSVIIEKKIDITIDFSRMHALYATLAQLVEHRFCKPTVESSSLSGGSIFFSTREKQYGSVPEWSNGEDCKSFASAS